MDFYKYCPMSQQSLHSQQAVDMSMDTASSSLIGSGNYDCYSLFGSGSNNPAPATTKWPVPSSNQFYNNNLTSVPNSIAHSLSNLAQSSTSMDMDATLSMLSSAPDRNDRKKLFVGNLPSNTSLEELVALFSKYGRVNEKLSVVKDDNYAFVHFYSERDAELAHAELNDSFFKNRYIRVQFSVSQGHVKKIVRSTDSMTRSASLFFNSDFSSPSLPKSNHQPTQSLLMPKSSTLNHINYASQFNQNQNQFNQQQNQFSQQPPLPFIPDLNNNNYNNNSVNATGKQPFYACNTSQSLLSLSAILGGARGGHGMLATNSSLNSINEAANWNDGANNGDNANRLNKAIGRPIRAGATSSNNLNTTTSSHQTGFYQPHHRQPSQWPVTGYNNLDLGLHTSGQQDSDSSGANNNINNQLITHQAKWANSLLMPAYSETNMQHQLDMLKLKQSQEQQLHQNMLMARLQLELELQLQQQQQQFQAQQTLYSSSLSSSVLSSSSLSNTASSNGGSNSHTELQ